MPLPLRGTGAAPSLSAASSVVRQRVGPAPLRPPTRRVKGGTLPAWGSRALCAAPPRPIMVCAASRALPGGVYPRPDRAFFRQPPLRGTGGGGGAHAAGTRHPPSLRL